MTPFHANQYAIGSKARVTLHRYVDESPGRGLWVRRVAGKVEGTITGIVVEPPKRRRGRTSAAVVVTTESGETYEVWDRVDIKVLG